MDNNMGSAPTLEFTEEEWADIQLNIDPQSFNNDPVPAQQVYSGQQAQGGLLLQESVSQSQIHATMAYPAQQQMYGDYQWQQQAQNANGQAAAMPFNLQDAAGYPAPPNYQKATAASRARQTSGLYQAHMQMNVSQQCLPLRR